MNRIKELLNKMIWAVLSESARMKKLRKRGVRIGTGCSIARNVFFGAEPYLIEIGNNVRLTSNVQFITHDGSLWVLRNLGLVDQSADKIAPISIGSNVNIGWNTMIMPGVKIGSNCIIGAGSIVTKDVPDNSVAAGVPARQIESIEEYCQKNRDYFDLTKGMDRKAKKQFLLEKYKR